MRTTVNLDEHLLEAAKSLAHQRGGSVSSVLEDGIRRLLTESSPSKPAAPLPTVGGSGLLPGVDLSSVSAFLMDEDDELPLDQRR